MSFRKLGLLKKLLIFCIIYLFLEYLKYFLKRDESGERRERERERNCNEKRNCNEERSYIVGRKKEKSGEEKL